MPRGKLKTKFRPLFVEHSFESLAIIRLAISSFHRDLGLFSFILIFSPSEKKACFLARTAFLKIRLRLLDL